MRVGAGASRMTFPPNKRPGGTGPLGVGRDFATKLLRKFATNVSNCDNEWLYRGEDNAGGYAR
jgi:hypothetical protein